MPHVQEEQKLPPNIDRMVASSQEEQRAQKMAAEAFERQQKAKSINLPTSDPDIKLALRQMKQPICLFGEDAAARRERLRTVLQKAYIEEGRIPMLGRAKEKKEAKDEKEVFYTHGCEELKAARLEIALFSIPKSTMR